MRLLGITFNEFIQKGNVIVGIILAILGVAMWLLAVNITKAVRRTASIKQNDTVLVTCRVVGLVSILIGMVLIALPL
jgi:hypothetical protein